MDISFLIFNYLFLIFNYHSMHVVVHVHITYMYIIKRLCLIIEIKIYRYNFKPSCKYIFSAYGLEIWSHDHQLSISKSQNFKLV